MVKLNLNLDSANGERPVMVYHSVHHRGKRFRITTGLMIAPKFWDKENQQVKRSRANYQEFNRILNEQVNELERVCLQLEHGNKAISRETVGPRISFATRASQPAADDFTPLGLFETFIGEHCQGLASSTLTAYRTAHKHLKGYFEQTGTGATFQHLDSDFYPSFKKYLNLYDNIFGNHIKKLKVFMKWAEEKGYHESQAYRKWKVTNEDGKEQFYLKFEEVNRLQLVPLDLSLDKVRDLFLIGCFTGLRYGDIMSLKPSHFQDGFISITMQKTTEPVQIPVVPQLHAVLNKYWQQKKPLPAISNQKGNQYLKRIAEAAGLDREFVYTQRKGRKVDEQILKAHQAISWHAARHSFITNCIMLGVNPEAVRRIVGHKTFKMMQRYIQRNPEFLKAEMMKLNTVTVNGESAA